MAKVRKHEIRPGEVPAAETSEDAAVVSAMYRALEEGDAAALARYADARIEWIDPVVTRLPFDGTRRGLPAVLRGAFRRDEAGAGPHVTPETFFEFGDGVLVVGRFIHRAGTGEGQVEEPFLQEWFVRGGRVVLIREYPAQTAERRKGDD
jgi:ketosteroid isomerase-like protein